MSRRRAKAVPVVPQEGRATELGPRDPRELRPAMDMELRRRKAPSVRSQEEAATEVSFCETETGRGRTA